MSRLQFTTGAGPWTYPPDAPHAFAAPAMSPSAREGVVARRSTKDSSKGSLPDPRNAAQRGSAKSAPHEARDYAARLIQAVAAPEALGHFRLSGIRRVQAEFASPPVHVNFQPLRALCFSLARYRLDRLGLQIEPQERPQGYSRTRSAFRFPCL